MAARSLQIALVLGVLGIGSRAGAQLTDGTQTTPGVPGGAIARSLEQQIGTGHGDELTYGSAMYLIKRDPARSIRRGRQLFQRKFTADQGFGPRVGFDSSGDIHTSPALGAGLVDSCAGCHGRPRGAAGFGGDVATRPDSRDAPHLFGLGLQEMLADEITAELRAQRDGTLAAAKRLGRPIARRLVSKGIDFGSVTAFANGTTDTSRVRGVDPDLRVRPFFHHGGTISIREFVIGALKDEMGLEASDPVLCAATDPVAPTRQSSAGGFVFDPASDHFSRPPVCDAGADRDGDGVSNEIDPAVVDHMEFYLLNYLRPGLGRQSRRTREGLELMRTARCTECHVQHLVVSHDRRVADVNTVHDPVRGGFNRLFATATTLFSAYDDGESYPQLLPAGKAFVVENIFADFRRHDLGPAFHERNYDGTRRTEFMTEPLWGVGSSAPYGHDGRSINLEEVILRHGGEAQRSRDAFARLSEDDQRRILEFLATLVLFPPDDTASNLNPGNPALDPQDPANHGSVNLGALFQISTEGPE
jgi:hypothetical protein